MSGPVAMVYRRRAVARAAHAGLGEGGHPVVRRQGEAQHGQGGRRAAALAQAQAEVEHGLEAEVVQQGAVSRLGRAVAGEQARAQAGLDAHRDGRRRGGDEAVAHVAEAVLARAQRQPAEDRDLAAAQSAQRVQRPARGVGVERERALAHRALARDARVVEPRARPDQLRHVATGEDRGQARCRASCWRSPSRRRRAR